MRVKEYIEMKMVFIVNTKDAKKIPLDENTSCPKRFTFKTEDILFNTEDLKVAKNAIMEDLTRNSYFWEFLEDTGLLEPLRILYIEFTYKGKEYSFSYLSESDDDVNWIEAGLYDEEFGMHSDFDFYEAYFGVDEENQKYYFD